MIRVSKTLDYLSPEEMKKILEVKFYSVNDLEIKLSKLEIHLLEMIAVGELTLSFTLRVEGDGRVEYVFLKFPEIYGS